MSLSLKGRADGFTLKGGDATAGAFTTMYNGPRPKPWKHGFHQGTYQPMKKQGAIILASTPFEVPGCSWYCVSWACNRRYV